MNCERLVELCELMLTVEAQFKNQANLDNLINDLQQVINNPNHPGMQTQYATRFQEIIASWAKMISSFDPQKAKLLGEIGAEKYFLDDFPKEVDLTARENPLTPAVTLQKIQNFKGQRENYLGTVRQLRDKLNEIGIKPYVIEQNSAEIGLLVPRELFHGKFDELIKELGTLNTIIRKFSVIATGHAEHVEVHQISTTDPVFFLGMSADTASLIGKAVTWAITTWAAVEGIRKLRSETQKNKSFSEDEVKSFFETKVEKTIKIAIDEKVAEMLGPPKAGAGERQEQRSDLAWALESILTRVERGMTMELRFLPPAQQKDSDGKPIPEPGAFQTLREIVPQLTFPPSEPSPILQLPPSEPPSETKSGTV